MAILARIKIVKNLKGKNENLMKTIDYISDLHINWHILTPRIDKFRNQFQALLENQLLPKNPSDILVVAGDVSEDNKETIAVLETLANYYHHVLFLFGNHDYYLLTRNQSEKYDNDSLNRAKEIKTHFQNDTHIHILDNQVITLNDLNFAGSSNWYQPVTATGNAFYINESNDSEFIKINNLSGEWPMITLAGRDNQFYETLCQRNAPKIDVMITHVPPIQPPFSKYPYNECYVHPVPELVAPHWIMGHQHVIGEFEKVGTQFHMNPIGYHLKPDSKIKTIIL